LPIAIASLSHYTLIAAVAVAAAAAAVVVVTWR